MSQYIKKQKILNEVIKEVGFNEYSQELIETAAHNLGIDRHYLELLFPNGIRSFNLFIIQEINNEFTEEVKTLDLEEKKINEKISLLLNVKLSILKKYKSLIKGIMSEMVYDPVEWGKALWKAADQIWLLIKDKSVDFNYYTKRISLSFLYVKMLLFFIQDSSENNIETEQYILREIKRIVQFTAFKKKLSINNIPIIRYLLRPKL